MRQMPLITWLRPNGTPFEPGAWPADTTVGYLVVRDVAHLFAHASELNAIATAAGANDTGLPGPLSYTRGRAHDDG